MKKAIVFPAGRGIPYNVVFPEEFDCEWAAEELGCEFIEIVRPRRLPRGFIMLCDEEGLLKPNMMNIVGSYFYESDVHGSPIAGNMMVLKEEFGPNGPECAGLTDEEIDRVFNLLRGVE